MARKKSTGSDRPVRFNTPRKRRSGARLARLLKQQNAIEALDRSGAGGATTSDAAVGARVIRKLGLGRRGAKVAVETARAVKRGAIKPAGLARKTRPRKKTTRRRPRRK